MTFSLHCNALLPDFSQPRFRDALAGMGLFQPYRCRGRLFPNGRGKFIIYFEIAGSGLNTLVKMKELQLGVFQKSKSGFQAVARPIEMFLSEQHSDSDVLARCAVAVVLDGSRAFVIEIQVSFYFPVCVLALVALCHICITSKQMVCHTSLGVV
nr:DNA repair protein RadA/Sms [Ipomoea batatas]GMD20575.1 DNA repair protein RadA/Sms [Ipomoea batatas]